MPRYLSWDAQNETKLFHAILAVHSIKIDYDAVAKIFGESLLRLVSPSGFLSCFA